MKNTTLDCLIGFISALFFALVLPVLLHGGLGFLGYDTLAARFPGLMGSAAGAFFGELILYVLLSAIIFVLYALTPLYKRAHALAGGSGTSRMGASIGWFFLGNVLGYAVFAVIVAIGFSAWRGPTL